MPSWPPPTGSTPPRSEQTPGLSAVQGLALTVTSQEAVRRPSDDRIIRSDPGESESTPDRHRRPDPGGSVESGVAGLCHDTGMFGFDGQCLREGAPDRPFGGVDREPGRVGVVHRAWFRRHPGDLDADGEKGRPGTGGDTPALSGPQRPGLSVHGQSQGSCRRDGAPRLHRRGGGVLRRHRPGAVPGAGVELFEERRAPIHLHDRRSGHAGRRRLEEGEGALLRRQAGLGPGVQLRGLSRYAGGGLRQPQRALPAAEPVAGRPPPRVRSAVHGAHR